MMRSLTVSYRIREQRGCSSLEPAQAHYMEGHVL